MIAIEFGNKAFNVPQSEQTVYIVFDIKTRYADRKEFAEKAIEKITLGYPDWRDELLAKMDLQPAKEEDIQFFIYGAAERMNENVTLDLDLENAHDFEAVMPVEWNDASYIFECGEMYVFYNWNTTC